jgi:hypothetical protein
MAKITIDMDNPSFNVNCPKEGMDVKTYKC